MAGFDSQIGVLADQLTEQALSYQRGDDLLSQVQNSPVLNGNANIEDMEDLMRRSPGVIYLPGLFGG